MQSRKENRNFSRVVLVVKLKSVLLFPWGSCQASVVDFFACLLLVVLFVSIQSEMSQIYNIPWLALLLFSLYM